MKQVLQSPRSGEIAVAEVPVPARAPGFVLVQTAVSLVSAGTERLMVEFGEKSLLGKALARPDLLAQVVEKIRRDGVLATMDAVQTRLDVPMPLGYSAAGTVIHAGPEVGEFRPGDRVACAGAGFANHAEVIAVPRQLCAALPGSVSFEEAAFATVGAIALHGLRLAELQMGERAVIIGLGLIGQLAAQLARAAGCRVFGVDPLADRCQLAVACGADGAVPPGSAPEAVRAWSAGSGADAVIIAADARDNGPVELAGRLARDRAVIVAVGAVGLELPRRTYYAKELRFVVARSLGPGRYDPEYELRGRDYPIGYVRWTEGRNLVAFLDLMARGVIQVGPLITHRFPIEEAPRAYELIAGRRREPFLGVLLTYPAEAAAAGHRTPTPARLMRPVGSDTVSVSVLGAGAFARSILLPALAAVPGVRFVTIASRQGLTATAAAQRFGFAAVTTEEAQLLGDEALAVVIATPHHLHAQQALAACAAGKHVFVEKPLCLTQDELEALEAAFGAPDAPILMVGFNRRFAPLAQELAAFFADEVPVVAHYRVNAGEAPADHWVRDPEVGGDRIVGEACHFVDFLGWLLRGRPIRVSAASPVSASPSLVDTMVITIEYDNGGIGTVTYVVAGDRRLGKERIEVHGGGRSAVLTDFRRLELYRHGRRHLRRALLRPDKGHRAECAAFVRAVREGGPSPISLAELIATTRVTFLAREAARLGRTLPLAG